MQYREGMFGEMVVGCEVGRAMLGRMYVCLGDMLGGLCCISVGWREGVLEGGSGWGYAGREGGKGMGVYCGRENGGCIV